MPKLEMWPARRAGTSTKEADVNWLWINIPLMAVFFLATTGIPLWLVFKHPDRRPAQEGQALPDSVAALYAASQTVPVARAAHGGYRVPSLVQARQ
jgi:Flp pilus assembly protein TadB